MTVTLRGLTWDHPRGYLVLDALAAAADPGGPDQRGPDGGDADAGYSVRWERQPLEDFESRPLRTLAGHSATMLEWRSSTRASSAW